MYRWPDWGHLLDRPPGNITERTSNRNSLAVSQKELSRFISRDLGQGMESDSSRSPDWAKLLLLRPSPHAHHLQERLDSVQIPLCHVHMDFHTDPARAGRGRQSQ
jgi:hypothetical protein